MAKSILLNVYTILQSKYYEGGERESERKRKKK